MRYTGGNNEEVPKHISFVAVLVLLLLSTLGLPSAALADPEAGDQYIVSDLSDLM
jgi:hypothetical protein